MHTSEVIGTDTFSSIILLAALQEGAALIATFMRRRIVFVSLVVGRLLLVPEARVVRLSGLLHFESRQQVLNLSSCRDKDGSIEGEESKSITTPFPLT